jgi:hypothetical protein
LTATSTEAVSLAVENDVPMDVSQVVEPLAPTVRSQALKVMVPK